MGWLDLWRWCRENNKQTVFTKDKTHDCKRGGNVNPSPSFPKPPPPPSPPPVNYIKDGKSKPEPLKQRSLNDPGITEAEKRKKIRAALKDWEPVICNEDLVRFDKRLAKVEERLDFLWKGSVEPRVILLERDLSTVAETINKLIESNNICVKKVENLDKQFPYAFSDTYYLVQKVNEILIALKEKGIVDIDDINIVQH
jgi:hypothetical protein